MKRNKNGIQGTPRSTLTESGSRCCSRKAENSTRRSLVVPMERPCQAGTEGAAADAGSNPGRPISTFKAGPVRLTSGLRPGLGLGPAKQLSLTHPPHTHQESRGRRKSGGWGDSGQGPRGTTLGSASRQRGPRLRAGAHPTRTRGPAGRRQGPQETSGDCPPPSFRLR